MADLFENQQLCKFDKSILKGRSDKLFCNLKCKNAYNNLINRNREKIFKPYGKKLHKNYKALRMFYEFSQDEVFIQIRPLFQQGFDPCFYIGTLKLNDTGEIIYLVYDYAFLYDKELGIKIFYNEGGFYNF
jgi:hypothetical protein